MKLRIFLLILFIMSQSNRFVQAQDTGNTAESSVIINSISFAELEFETVVLRDPLDSFRYRFFLPMTWEINDSAELTLAVDFVNDPDTPATASLEIIINGNYLETVLLSESTSYVITNNVPVEMLIPYLSDGWQEIRLILSGATFCENTNTFIAAIGDESTITFSYNMIESPLDFRVFPRPIIQDSINIDSTLLVIPDQPLAGTLNAVLNVFAAFGDLSDGRLDIELRRRSELSPADYTDHHLIFVGQINELQMGDITLDFPIVDGRFTGFPYQVSDGILQLAHVPGNTENVVLIVSGESEEAVLKASQSISYGNIIPYNPSNLAVISEIEPQIQILDSNRNISFADAGYANNIVYHGTRTLYYLFDLPFGNRVNEDSYLSLELSHTSLLDYDNSGVTVRVNGIPVTTLTLSDDTASRTLQRIDLPSTVFHQGINEIAIDVQLMAKGNCFSPDSNLVWLNVDSASSLNFSFNNEQERNDSAPTLNSFPDPFVFTPALQSTAFILPSTSAIGEWQVATKIAFSLGERSFGQFFDIDLAFDDSVDDDFLNSHHLIIIGSQEHPFLPVVLTSFENTIPENNADSARLRNIRFEVGDRTNLGYLQVHSSPWNDEFVLLSIISDTSEGLNTSGLALTTPTTRRQISGNFAIINNSQIIAENVPRYSDQVSENGIRVLDDSGAFVFDNTSRLVVFGIVAGVLILIIVVIAGIFYRMSRRRN